MSQRPNCGARKVRIQKCLRAIHASLRQLTASSYASSRSDSSYVSYFASTTPESESKRVRLKTVLFLQGSSLYDPEALRTRLSTQAKILKLELAILEGKVRIYLGLLQRILLDRLNVTRSWATIAQRCQYSYTT